MRSSTCPGESTLSARKNFYGQFIQSLVISYALEHVSRSINSIRARKFLWLIYTMFSDIICAHALALVNQLYPRTKIFNANLGCLCVFYRNFSSCLYKSTLSARKKNYIQNLKII